MKKIILLLTAIGFIIFALSGCVKAELDVNVNKDKSADVNATFLVNSLLVGLTQNNGGINLDEIKNGAEKAGFKAVSQKDGDMIGYKFSKHYDNINELITQNAGAIEITSLYKNGETKAKIFTVEKGFFKDVYTVNLDMDLSDIKNTDESSNEFTNSIVDRMIAQMDLKFKTTLPVKTVSNNASIISADGKSLEWQLIPGKKNNVQLQFSVLNIFNIVMTIVIILIVLLVLLLLLLKNQKRKIRSTPLYENSNDDIDNVKTEENKQDDEQKVQENIQDNQDK